MSPLSLSLSPVPPFPGVGGLFTRQTSSVHWCLVLDTAVQCSICYTSQDSVILLTSLINPIPVLNWNDAIFRYLNPPNSNLFYSTALIDVLPLVSLPMCRAASDPILHKSNTPLCVQTHFPEAYFILMRLSWIPFPLLFVLISSFNTQWCYSSYIRPNASNAYCAGKIQGVEFSQAR